MVKSVIRSTLTPMWGVLNYQIYRIYGLIEYFVNFLLVPMRTIYPISTVFPFWHGRVHNLCRIGFLQPEMTQSHRCLYSQYSATKSHKTVTFMVEGSTLLDNTPALIAMIYSNSQLTTEDFQTCVRFIISTTLKEPTSPTVMLPSSHVVACLSQIYRSIINLECLF